MKEATQREYIMFVLHNLDLVVEVNEAGANNLAAWLVKWIEEH